MPEQQRVGWRSYISPLSSLLTSIYGVWNAETTSTTLATGAYGAWNGEGIITPTQLSASMSNAWNTGLDKSIINPGIAGVWNGNGNANDSVSTNHGTIIGGVTYGTAKIGSNSFQFNGSTGYVRLPGDSLKFTGDFTVSYWFLQSFNGATGGFTQIACYNYVGGVSYGWTVGISNVYLNFSIYGASNVTLPTSNRLDGANGTINIGNGGWHHVVITRKAGTRSRIYVDGILQGSNTSAVNPAYNATSYSTIGGYQYSTGAVVTIAGNIDAISSWNRELSADEVFSLYNNASGVESPYSGKGPVLVDSISSLSGYLYGGASFSTGKLGTNALTFDGINDYVQLPNNSMNFTGDFSISAWLYFPTDTQLTSDSGYILSNWTAVTWATNLAGWRFETSGNTIYFSTFNGTSTSVSLGAPGMGLDRSGWRHIAFTRTGTTYKLWLDGGQYTATSTTMLVPKYQGTIIPKIGRLGDSTMQGWDSYNSAKIKIEAVSVWQRAITSDEISALYNSGNGQLYPFSNVSVSSAVDSVSTNHGTIVGGVTYTTGVVGNAFSFNGSTGYITYPNDTFKLTGNFSINVWVKLNAIGSTQTILSTGTSTSNGFRTYVGSNNKIYFEYSNAGIGNYFTSATTLVANTWYNIALVNTGSVYKIYINGTLDATNVSSPVPSTYQTITWSANGTNLAILGRYISSVYFLNGSIDMPTVWTKALTDDEITQLYNLGGGIQYPFTTQTIKTPYAVYNGDSLVDPIGARNAAIVGGVTYTAGKVGNAYTFNGSTGYLTLPANSMRFAGSFSISMWIYPTVYPTIAQGTIGLISNPSLGYGDGYDISFYNNGSNVISLYSRFGTANGNATFPIQLQATAPPLNTWTLVTITFEAGVGAKTYYNGVLQGSVSSSITTLLYTNMPTTYTPTIGYGSNATGPFVGAKFAGQIDGLTFWNSALTAPEVITLFNDGNGMEYPYSSTLTAKLPSFTDVFATNHGTSPATSAPTFTVGKVGKAYNFDGINDYVELPSNSLNSLTGNFSISMWVKWGRNNISQILIANLNTNYGLGFFVEHAAGQLRFKGYKSAATNAFYAVKNSYTPTIGIWYHYTFTHKDQVNNIYENGVLIASDTTTTGHINHGVTNWPTIGANKYNSTSIQEPFQGAIDMVNIWTKELSASEVTDLYNSGNGKQYPNY